MANQPYLSVIIPAYNEEPNFKKGTIDDVSKYLEKQDYTYEILIVDDGSEDNTAKLADNFATKHKNVKSIKNPHQGKAETVKRGVSEAKGELILFTDFDQATPLSEIEKLLPFIPEYDIVIGSRQLPGAKREKEPIHRHLMGLVFNLIVQIIAVRGIWDTQAGFKLFKAEVAKKLFSQGMISISELDLKHKNYLEQKNLLNNLILRQTTAQSTLTETGLEKNSLILNNKKTIIEIGIIGNYQTKIHNGRGKIRCNSFSRQGSHYFRHPQCWTKSRPKYTRTLNSS